MVQSELVEQFDTAIVPLMTADEARACISEIHLHAKTIRARLFELYERRGWAALGHATWDDCCDTEFPQYGRTYVHYQIKAAQIERQIADVHHGEHEIGTIPERQLRPLAPYKDDPEAARKIWENAQYAAAENNGKLTSKHVEQAVREWRADDQDVFTDPEAEEYQAIVDERKAAPMAVHFTSNTPEWYTPERIVNLVIEVLGQIDLDPCSNSDDPSIANVPARKYYTAQTDGLAQQWFGKVYMNPPYGDEIGPWVEKLVSEYQSGRITDAIALVPGRIDTAWIQPLYDYALCLVRGRLRFVGGDNSAPFPSIIVYLGADNDSFFDCFEQIGRTGLLR